MKRRAFTLIELLVTIVIIGLIAMIIIPLVGSKIASAKISSFEESAKRIATQIKNNVTSGDIYENQINCMSSQYGTYNENYASCTANIYYGDETDIISVDVVGKGTYAGYVIIGAKEDTAHVIESANTQNLKTVLIAGKIGDVTYGTPPATGGLYQWGSKYIYRGGITITNRSGLAPNEYVNDSYDKTTDIANYVKVPWENNTEACRNATPVNDPYAASSNSPCWRIISINQDGSITIVRDRNLTSGQSFDISKNVAANIQYGDEIEYGFNDLLANTPVYPEDYYRSYSLMYTRLYGASGYQNSLKNYYYLLQPLDVCLNKVNDYVGINNLSYQGSTVVKDTCDLTGRTGTFKEVNPLRNQYVRLPYTEEYINAALEGSPNNICTGSAQYQCRGRNFMYNKTTYWSVNGRASSSWSMRHVYVGGDAGSSSARNSSGVRPVVTLKHSVLISGGTGTDANPYLIKW